MTIDSTSASETIVYAYDAHGRLIKISRSGTVNNGVQVSYRFDPADNRTKLTVEAARGRAVVVPLNGLTVFAIPDP